MKLDNDKAFEVFRDEPVWIDDAQDAVYAMVDNAGDPVSGGAINTRQDGDQYTLRILKTDWPAPVVHASMRTKNFGTLRIKQKFSENDYWSLLCTGKVRARHDA